MTVASLLDAAAGGRITLDGLREALESLELSGWSIGLETVKVGSIEARHFNVEWDAKRQPHRDWTTIRGILERGAAGALGEAAAGRAIRIFEGLAQAEAKVHGTTPAKVHFHEVGAVDSIIDIVGAAWCLERLGIDACFVGPVVTGSGHVQTEHGRLPVPAPATALLLRGFDVVLGDGQGELTTPTGAAILAAEAKPFRPSFALRAVGSGAGTKRLADRPNILRVFLGEAETTHDEELVFFEADIDDMSPEALAFAAEQLRSAGARDVGLQPLGMKKGRVGMRLSVLCDLGRLDELANLALRETTTLGLRYRSVARRILARETLVTETSWGAVVVKIGVTPDGERRAKPEFEDVARVAREAGVPFAEVHAAALAAAAKADA